jgi:hypothetical protein
VQSEQAIVYERFSGAASETAPAAYRPRKPQDTVLHQVVRENLLSFLAEGELHSEDGEGYPLYIEKELREYIGCSDLSRGFARVRCQDCGFERLLPFSCKNRGICPSCTTRRMSDEAAFMVDILLPQSRYRQWTVTFPWHIRYLMARDHKLISAVLRVVMSSIFTLQRQQARRLGVPTRQAKTAGQAMIQRFGSALNSNCHPHILTPDAVFVLAEDAEQLELVELPPPTDEQVARVVEKIARRTTSLVQKYFATVDGGQDLMGGAIHDAMFKLPPVGHRDDDQPSPERRSKRCAQLDGFSVHANTSIAADNRLGLEKLCRYGMRPAFSHQRLSLDSKGRVLYRLRKPWPKEGGVEVLSFEPVTFLRRLAPLIPPPYANLIRYYGLFAPNAKYRDLLPPAPPSPYPPRPAATVRTAVSSLTDSNKAKKKPSGKAEPSSSKPSVALLPNGKRPPRCARPDNHPRTDSPQPTPSSSEPQAERPQRKTVPWAELLRRVFAVDALLCPRCAGPMVVLAFLTEVHVVTRILKHLGLPSSPATLSPARVADQLELFDAMADQDDWPGEQREGACSSRGPPVIEGDWVVEYDEPQDDY